MIDETESVALAHDAVCAPDIFVFNAALERWYRRGSMVADGLVTDAQREVFEAMCRIADTGEGPAEQQASMGRSIK